jgi:hypothetical protein
MRRRGSSVFCKTRRHERNVKRSTMVCSIDRERLIFEAKPSIRCAVSIFFAYFRFLWQFLRFHVTSGDRLAPTEVGFSQVAYSRAFVSGTRTVPVHDCVPAG